VNRFFKFWDPLYISGTFEARNSNFGTHVDPGALTKYKYKNTSMEVRRAGSRDKLQIWNADGPRGIAKKK